ncbi:MAG: glycosyltransferase family 4 protein [Actinobacteria bacterium]|nr:glycosyltransferase family 4 protein [Actinomycetota bacterium]
MKHLLVTNDFPPKTGGIQSYLWELWRRLPADEVAVMTTGHPGAAAWDAAQPFRVERAAARVLVPTPALGRRIRALADEVGAELVLLDPVLWGVGPVARWLDRPYGVVVHGAEVTVPGRLPIARAAMAGVLRGAQVVVAAGGYPADRAEAAARRGLPVVVVPPGVDTERFRPLDAGQRRSARERLGLPATGPLVVGVSRLVPRKGFDVLIRAASVLRRDHPDLTVAVAGDGRDRRRLERLVARTGAPVRLVGRIGAADLPRLHGAADVFAMLCRDRWAGLEQEGFGIVFVEAAACGVPQVAGRSGGSHEAVVDGVTGLVVDDSDDEAAAVRAIGMLLADPGARARMGAAALARARADLSYDVLAERLRAGLEGAGS